MELNDYTVNLIGTLFLFGFFAVVGFIAWVSNIGNDRPFNPEWPDEIRKATRIAKKPRQRPKTPLVTRVIQKRVTGYRRLVCNWGQQLPSVWPRPAFLDSAGVVRVIATNARSLSPRYIHPYLDFIDGTVQWRVTLH